MRKNIIMLCSALSFAMAATDDACAMIDTVSDISFEAEASTTVPIANLEKAIEGKLARDTVTTSFPIEGAGDCLIVTCSAQSVNSLYCV